MSLADAASPDIRVAVLIAALIVGWLALSWLCHPSLRLAGRWRIIGLFVVCAAIAGIQCASIGTARVVEGITQLIARASQADHPELLLAIASIALMLPAMLIALLDGYGPKVAARLLPFWHAMALRLARRQGLRDALTGLPSKAALAKRLERAARRSDRQGGGLALLYIDVDGFRPLNETFGREFGDAVLRELAARLVAQLRGVDAVARIGSDEFAVLLDGQCDAEATARVAQRIIAAASAPMSVGEREVQLSCSIGAAIYPADGPRGSVLAHAKVAMQAAKRAGGSRCLFFRPGLEAGASEQAELHHDLRTALDRGGELELHFQPKVRAVDSVVTGFEALLRWQHPLRGMVEPLQFIPVAERFGLMSTLGNWVIDEACRQMAAWRLEGLRIPVAINLSTQQFLQDDLAQRVAQALSRHALAAGLLTFEITESTTFAEGSGAMRALDRLRALGVQLAIDDFGTGYSSLSYLRRVQVDQLKIDRSFLRDLDTNPDARAIVAAVVEMGHALGLRVVAEGVEREDQRRALLALQCDELQGYLIAMPMTARAVSRLAAGCGATSLKFSNSTFVADGPVGSSVVLDGGATLGG